MSESRSAKARGAGAPARAAAADAAKATTRRGRERRAAILAAASEVFLEAGYAGASVDAIIARAGGSKRTLYAEFGNKEGLFATMVKENVAHAMEALAAGEEPGHDLRSTLLSFGGHLSSLLMSPPVLALYRTVVHEGTRFPELATLFWDNGPGAVVERLAAALEGYRRRGEIRIDDCRAAADAFVGMMRGNRHLLAVLGLRPPPEPAEVEAIVAVQVDLFLDGIRVRAPSASRKVGEVS